MNRLLREPGLAAKLSVCGHEKITTLGLTWAAHGRRLLSIYSGMLGSR
jgi:hypothetical protein